VLALHSTSEFLNSAESEDETSGVSDGFGRFPTDFRTNESERLSSEGVQETSSISGSEKVGERLPVNDSGTIESTLDPPAEPRVIKGGADAMEGAVRTLSKLMADALEAGDWDLAESLNQQLARVIAVRTSARKKMSGL
jgi:hypothetical protein